MKALIPSLSITFVLTILIILYELFPLLMSFIEQQEGVGAVAGGVSNKTMMLSVFVELILFVFIFTLLQRRKRLQ